MCLNFQCYLLGCKPAALNLIEMNLVDISIILHYILTCN